MPPDRAVVHAEGEQAAAKVATERGEMKQVLTSNNWEKLKTKNLHKLKRQN